jgi:hypothetical protein
VRRNNNLGHCLYEKFRRTVIFHIDRKRPGSNRGKSVEFLGLDCDFLQPKLAKLKL